MITEFSKGETCTATVYPRDEDGQGYVAPLHVGFYREADEVWIDQDGQRVQLPGASLEDLVKQLRRARKIATEAMS